MNSVYTVLIVDDTEEDRFILKRFLSKTELPLVILEASSGAEAIELMTTPIAELETLHPGISAPVTLFLDINMPLMNGWEFVEEIERRYEDIELAPTIVLMHSTSDDNLDKQKATQYKSIVNYIVKGESTPDTLRKAVLTNR